MKKQTLLFVSCIIFSLFLIQLSSAILSWDDFGGENTQLTQAQFSSVGSRFDVASTNTDTLGQGQTFNKSNLPYQPLVALLTQDENVLIIQNGNYLQIYDENLNLLDELLTGSSEGQLGVASFDNESGRDIIGFYSKNITTVTFRVFNVDENYTISQSLEKNITLGNITTNGVRCTSGECYAFISERVNATTYLHYFQIITYNSTSNNVDLTTYSFAFGSSPILEPPAYIDWDFDATTEFLGFSNNSVFVVDYGGSVELNYPYHSKVVGAKFIKADAGDYKVLIVSNNPNINPPCPTATYNCIMYIVVKSDTTTLWENKVGSLNSGDTWRTGGIAIADYNGDGYEDIFTTQMKTGTNHETRMQIYKGSDGSNLYLQTYGTPFTTGYDYPQFSLSIGRMGLDSTYDFVGSRGNAMYIWDTTNNSMIYTESTGYTSCVPADLTYDNLLDVVCSSTAQTKLFTSNYTNQNAYIDSVAYSPSLVIEVNSTLYALISAIDDEGDSPLYYSIKCNNSASWSSDTTSDTQSCFYDTIGQFNVSVRVRDVFHSEYDSFSTTVTVTTTGEVCDNDGICEAEQGETYINCPNDCEQPTGTTQVEGGVAIPQEIVSTENYNEGFLPEIYYGMLAFFSYTLNPFIVLVFLIIFVLIVLVIGTIVKKIAVKVVER